MEDRREVRHRQRSSIACEPCRSRKRKCPGGDPCSMCSGYGYDCFYRSTPRRRRRQNGSGERGVAAQRPLSASPQSIAVQSEVQLPPDSDTVFVRSQESNSGSAFVRSFAMSVDYTPPFQTLAWNLFLGERQMALPAPPQSITELLSATDMQALSMIYFDKVDPCYGFIDRPSVEQEIQQRWLPGSESCPHDAVLCGLAAIACVFSTFKDLQTEVGLASLAKSLLDYVVSEEPTVTIATAWVLRTAYLRLTARPEEAWMASCTALHMIDATGLHCEPDPNTLFRRAGRDVNPDTRRRIFGVARHLNIWLSFDLARSRLILQNASPVLPSPRHGDYTTELLELLPFTEILDPGKALSGAELVTSFAAVLNRTHTRPPSILAQCNLMLCLYRRLYTLRWKVPNETLEKAVSLIQKGIRAVHMSMENGSPWHHLANIPFQSICTLLAIDTAQSFTLMNDAMSCLETLSRSYPTRATREALTAARALLYMHQKRREADVRRQSDMLKLYPAAQPAPEETFDAFPLTQAFTDLPWFNELIPDVDLGTLDQFFNS